MVEVEKEISLYDIVDWVWSYRLLALVISVVVIAATIAMSFIEDKRAPQYLVRFEVYIGGTPVRSITEIIDILTTKLDKTTLVSPRGSNPAVFSVETKAKADATVAIASQVDKELLAEVDARLKDLRALSTSRDGSPTAILQVTSFLRSIESGLVTLVRSDVNEIAPAQSRSKLLIPAALGSIMLILLVAIHSFWLGWRRHLEAAA